jgi:23S rRNA (guanosine2251-2'-O)-methyltransferase
MSNRDKQNRKARINREKEQKQFEKKEFKSKFNRKNIQNRFTTNKPNRDYKQVNQDDFDNEQKSYEDIVAGRNAVMELLKSGKDINKIFVENGEKHGSINEIIARAKENRIVLIEVDKSKLDQMAENHQGVVAQVPPFDYCEVEDILDLAKERGEDPFIIVLEGIEDPHNLGAIIRTAETAGVHGIIIPKRRSVAVNATVSKVSAGATSYMKIARVNNINETIKKLKDNGLWVIGTDGAADTLYYNQDLKGPLAIIIGSEGFGMSKLVRENSDILIKIPMKGKVTSLNASVSAGIVIYEALRQRN